jgi:hypothetical protein
MTVGARLLWHWLLSTVSHHESKEFMQFIDLYLFILYLTVESCQRLWLPGLIEVEI